MTALSFLEHFDLSIFYNVPALIIGFFGIAANVMIYQQTDGKKLLLFKLISDVLWSVQFVVLGAFTGAAVSLIAIVRELIFMNKDKKWAQSKWWLVLFLALAVASAIFTWKNTFSLLPMCASMISVVGFWLAKPKVSRILSFPVSLCMMTYDFFSGSLMGIVNELLTMTSSAIRLIKSDRK